MQSTWVRTLDAGRRVQGFLDTQPPAIGSVVPAPLRAKLDAAVTQFGGFLAEQSTADATARGETVNQAALRKELFAGFMDRVPRSISRSTSYCPDNAEAILARSAVAEN